jgi:hypothetical protein
VRKIPITSEISKESASISASIYSIPKCHAKEDLYFIGRAAKPTLGCDNHVLRPESIAAVGLLDLQGECKNVTIANGIP